MTKKLRHLQPGAAPWIDLPDVHKSHRWDDDKAVILPIKHPERQEGLLVTTFLYCGDCPDTMFGWSVDPVTGAVPLEYAADIANQQVLTRSYPADECKYGTAELHAVLNVAAQFAATLPIEVQAKCLANYHRLAAFHRRETIMPLTDIPKADIILTNLGG